MKNKHTYSLLEIILKIQNTIEKNFFDYFTVIVEIASININRSRHCYLELVEKDTKTNKIIAKAKAIIWASNFLIINSYFKSITGNELQSGIKVLIKAGVNFHEVYGFSLNIVDIDPNYTLGDIERQRLEILNRLEQEGVVYMNKDLEIPLVIKNIAIISSDTAAGYEDFVNQLNNNSYGFVYHTKLYKAYMQGNEVENSIISALEKIYHYHNLFDIVVIIRGGGSRIELAAFDNYNLAYYITQFPLPVITGIGHERDKSICDIVANISVKTPTAAAEFIIENSLEFLSYIEHLNEKFNAGIYNIIDYQKNIISEFETRLKYEIQKYIDDSKHKFDYLSNKIQNSFFNYFFTKKNNLSNYISKVSFLYKITINNNIKILNDKKLRLRNVIRNYIEYEKYQLKISEIIIRENNPENFLKKGYIYITKNNHFVKDLSEIKTDDIIVNIGYNIKIESKVIKTKKKNINT